MEINVLLPGILHQSSWPWGVVAAWTGCECHRGACRCRGRRRWGPEPCSRAPLHGALSVLTASGPGTHKAGTSGNHLVLPQRSPPPSRWSRCWWCNRCWAPRWLRGESWEIITMVNEDWIYRQIWEVQGDGDLNNFWEPMSIRVHHCRLSQCFD